MTRPNRLPPIHALAAFESAARLGGFAQAAAELCITPSAVSHRVRVLEELWGEQLFERSPTGVRLSAAGQSYLKGVRESFEALARLGGPAADAPPHLRVGVPPTFARNLLIPALPSFYRQCPGIDVDVFVVAPMQDKPPRHDVDVRFGAPPFDERPALKLFEDDLVALASPAFVARRTLRRAQDLHDPELLRSPLIPWQPWFEAAGLARPEPARGAAFTDLGILLEAAASGLGVALCTRRIAAQWLGTGQLQALFGLSAPSPQTYYVLIGSDQATRVGVAAFGEWLREALA
jgi:DNA-binding transcriptional LysR family regulator